MPKRTVEGSGKKVAAEYADDQALREKLEKAAGLSGRSLVQEVEFRLEQSFAGEDLGKLHISTLMWRVHDCCVLIEAYTGKNCFEVDAVDVTGGVSSSISPTPLDPNNSEPAYCSQRGGSGGRWPTCDGLIFSRCRRLWVGRSRRCVR